MATVGGGLCMRVAEWFGRRLNVANRADLILPLKSIDQGP